MQKKQPQSTAVFNFPAMTTALAMGDAQWVIFRKDVGHAGRVLALAMAVSASAIRDGSW